MPEPHPPYIVSGVRLVEWSFREKATNTTAPESGFILRNTVLKYNPKCVSLAFFQGCWTLLDWRNINNLVEAMECFPTKMHIWITPWGITKWHGIPRPMDPRLISYAQITQISSFWGVM